MTIATIHTVEPEDFDNREAAYRDANAVALVGRAEAEQLQPVAATNTATALRNKKALVEAKLRLAKLNLSNTLIRAPQAGIISRRTIQLGQTVAAASSRSLQR